jgi:Zn-dependent protease/CBS domain-containing protein
VNGNFKIASVLGIPIVVNVSWIATLIFVTSVLALRFYPEVIPPDSPDRDNTSLHWAMAIASGLAFFTSIVLHELAHSVIARRQGIPVKNITLFIFGGVSQIAGEARRPLHEFVMAIVGPLTSLLIAGACFAVWFVLGQSEEEPLSLVLEWLFLMNLVLAIFNMAPGFPMDGGRVLRAMLWGFSGNLLKATRLATLVGRSLGYGLMILGFVSLLGVISFIDPWSGVWMGLLGMFLESSAKQSWFQARAMAALSKYKTEDVMAEDTETVTELEPASRLADRGGRHFAFFVTDIDDRVVGVVTEKELELQKPGTIRALNAGQLMLRPEEVETARPAETGDTLLQRMETNSVWHLPVVSEGRLIGVVSKERLLLLLARSLLPQTARPLI